MREKLLHPNDYRELEFVKRNPKIQKLKAWLLLLAVAYLLLNVGVTWHLSLGIKRTMTSNPNRLGVPATNVEFTTGDSHVVSIRGADNTICQWKIVTK